MYKSEMLAQHLRQMIENGVWQAHEKLPSLREQTLLSGLSLITVLNAYQSLEVQGLVYAKNKSGFYVAPRQFNATETALKDKNPEVRLKKSVQINSAVFHYLKSIQAIGIAPSLLFMPENDQQNFLRLNCSYVWSKSIEQAMQQICQSIRHQGA